VEKLIKLKIIRTIKGDKTVFIVYCPKKEDEIPHYQCRSCEHYLGGTSGRALYCSYKKYRDLKLLPYGF